MSLKEKFTNLLKGRRFCFITSETPENKDNTELHNLINNLGVPYLPVTGKYEGNEENAFLVFDIPKVIALNLCRKFKQDCVLINEGLLNNDGTFYSGDLNNIKFYDSFEDNYSMVLIDNRELKFSIPIDFSERKSFKMFNPF